MQFDVERLSATDRYELLLSTVMPRPIALITTLSQSKHPVSTAGDGGSDHAAVACRCSFATFQFKAAVLQRDWRAEPGLVAGAAFAERAPEGTRGARARLP